MSVETGVLVVSVLGPLLTALVIFLSARRNRAAINDNRAAIDKVRTNDLAHVEGELNQINVRLGRLEQVWDRHLEAHGIRFVPVQEPPRTA